MREIFAEEVRWPLLDLKKKASIFTAKSRVADGPCMVGMYAKSLARAWSGLDPVVAFRGV
jgi:hypothetical protein